MGLSLELSNYYEESGSYPMIRHPLLYAVPFFDTAQEVDRLNKTLEVKKVMLQKALEEKDWYSYVFLHERPYRINAFSEISILYDKTYWELLGRIWVDSENIYENRMKWWELLTCSRRKKRFIMNTEDRSYFKKLPKKITAYRGTDLVEKNGNYLGYSYTLDEEKAKWFATRFNTRNEASSFVLTAILDKSKCIAYISERGEQEIIAMPNAVMQGTWEVLK